MLEVDMTEKKAVSRAQFGHTPAKQLSHTKVHDGSSSLKYSANVSTVSLNGFVASYATKEKGDFPSAHTSSSGSVSVKRIVADSLTMSCT